MRVPLPEKLPLGVLLVDTERAAVLETLKVPLEHCEEEREGDWLGEVEGESVAEWHFEGEWETLVDCDAEFVREGEGVEVPHRDGDSVPLVLPLPQLLPLGLGDLDPLCVLEDVAQKEGVALGVTL